MKNISKKGFTLSELLVVIVIIGILAVVAIPSVILVNKNINKRLYSGKVDTIVSAAEIYASENPDIFNGKTEVIIYVAQLLQTDMLKIEETDQSIENCTSIDVGGEKYVTTGCILDPRTNTSMNDKPIILRKDSTGIHVDFCSDDKCSQLDNTSDDLKKLNEIVCGKMASGDFSANYTKSDGTVGKCSCEVTKSGTTTTLSLFDTSTRAEVSACIISGNPTDNWLYYSPDGDTNFESSYYWRVMGLYKVNNEVIVKMITDELID